MARQKGQDQLIQCIENRLTPDEDGNRKVPFRDTLPRNKYLTFSSVFEVKQTEARTAKKVVYADRKFLQRLITASKAGRDVNLDQIIIHELMPVPPALAEMNSSLQSGRQSVYRKLFGMRSNRCDFFETDEILWSCCVD